MATFGCDVDETHEHTSASEAEACRVLTTSAPPQRDVDGLVARVAALEEDNRTLRTLVARLESELARVRAGLKLASQIS